MKTLGNFVLIMGSLLAMAALPSQAQIISLKLYVNSGDQILTTDSAGVVATNMWNNQNINTSLSGTNLTDNSGTATTLDYVLNPNGGGNGSGVGNSSNGINKLYASGRDGSNNGSFPTTLTFSQIPYATYDIYVYFAAGFTDRKDSFTMNGVTYYAQTNASAAGYVPATSTTAGVFTLSNYVVFTGLTGTSQTLTGITMGNGSTTYEGFQVVAETPAAPEPSTYVLLGLGLGAFVAIRRFRALV